MSTHAISKRVLSLMLAIVLVLGMIPVFASAADTTTIYVQPNSNWLTDDARFAAYFFGNGETWVDCVDAGDGLYSVEVPAGYPSVIFCRMNPGTTANSWSNKWNQTKDLTVPTDNKVVYVVDGWDKGNGQWIEKGGELEEIEVVYYLRGDMNGWGTDNPMTKNEDGTYSVTISLAAGTYTYKAADEGWGANWGEGGAGGGNLSITVEEDSNVTFTLDTIAGTVTHDYVPACTHEWDEGTVVTAATCTETGESTFTCTLCGVSKNEPVAALGHNYVNRICTVCGDEKPVLAFYLVGFINGADYGCEADYENMGEYKFVDGTLAVTFTADSYVYVKTEGNANWFMTTAYTEETTATFVEGGSEKMLVPGNVALIFTLVENSDGSLTLSYANDPAACAHEWDEGTVTSAATCTTAGVTTYTCGVCGQTKTEAIEALGHNYVDGVCATCGEAEPVVEYYLAGSFNEWNPGNAVYKLMQLGEVYYIGISLTAGNYEFKITDGSWESGNAWPTENYVLAVPADSDNISIMFYPETGEIEVSGIEQPEVEPGTLVLGDNTVGLGSYTFTATEDGLLNIAATSVSVFNEESGEWDVINPNMAFGMMYTLSINGGTNFMPENQVEVTAGDVVSIELTCRGDSESEIVLNLSYVVEEPDVDYYLIGYINGADYGCEGDWENLGEYKFIDGTLVATFDTDSYVFIKTGDNAKWFMTEAYCDDIIGVFVEGGTEKMFVPGGVEITFYLSENPNGSLTMSYSAAEPSTGAVVGGTITSYLTDDDVTIELIQDGTVAYSVTVSGKSAAYSIVGVAAGSYTMKVSKANHVARECTIVVESADVTQDATICPLGDSSGDGRVNMKDWSVMYEHINEVNELEAYAFDCSDVNGDGRVNMKDWARLYEHINEINPLW